LYLIQDLLKEIDKNIGQTIRQSMVLIKNSLLK